MCDLVDVSLITAPTVSLAFQRFGALRNPPYEGKRSVRLRRRCGIDFVRDVENQRVGPRLWGIGQQSAPFSPTLRFARSEIICLLSPNDRADDEYDRAGKRAFKCFVR